MIITGTLRQQLSDAYQAWSDRGLDAEPVGGVIGWVGVALAVAYVAIVPWLYLHTIVFVPALFIGSIAEVLPKSQQQLVTGLRKATIGYLLLTPVMWIMLVSGGF